MMIAVISDTHRDIDSMRKSLESIRNYSLLIHLGDNVQDVEFYREHFKGEIFNVKGNCDIDRNTLTEKIIEVSGKKILLMHGHTCNVKYGLVNLKYKAMEAEVDVVLYGHTHIANIVFEEGVWFINPGSLSRPGYGKRSFATIEIKESRIIPCLNEL